MENNNSYIGKHIGNYRVVAEVARGSFGSVYQGTHLIFTERPAVAIKLLHDAYLGSSWESACFIQEARLLEKLKHPNCLSVLDAGIHEGIPYLIAEYATNGSLRAHLKRQLQRPLPVEEALTILSQIGQALQHAHQQNVVHRDLKPENILFNAKGDALLADFGIATVLATSSVRQVDVTGTPAYMAPEQFRGMISKESDQYSLGCIAYELFTGHQPFTAPDFVAMGFLHATEIPVPPTQCNPDLPAHIERAILKAMAKQRTDRHVDVSTFIWSLHASTITVADIPTVLISQASIEAASTSLLAQTSTSGTLQEIVKQQIKEGNGYSSSKHYQEALVAYEQVIRLDPNDADAYYNKGNVLSELGRPQEALVAYEQVIRLDPNDADAYIDKGNVLDKLERYREALAAYEQAICLAPNNAFAYYCKGNILEHLGRSREAKRAHKRARQIGYSGQ